MNDCNPRPPPYHHHQQQEEKKEQERFNKKCGENNRDRSRCREEERSSRRVGRKCAAYLMLLAVLIAHKSKKIHAFIVVQPTVTTPFSKKRTLTDILNNKKIRNGNSNDYYANQHNRNLVTFSREEVQSLTALHLWWNSKSGTARNTDLATTTTTTTTTSDSSLPPTTKDKNARILSSSSSSSSSFSNNRFSFASFLSARNDTGGAGTVPLSSYINDGTAVDDNDLIFSKAVQQQQQQQRDNPPPLFPTGLLSLSQPVQKVLDENTSGWALSYADLSPDNQSTPAGIAFLATNAAYALAGVLLTLQGDTWFGLLTDITAVVSFNYHYNQLDKAGSLKEDSVRMALLVDYIFAFLALGTAFVYLVMNMLVTTDFLSDPANIEALAAGGLGVLFLGLGWIWEVGRPYMVFHSLWHLLSAYAGYVIGVTHSHIF